MGRRKCGARSRTPYCLRSGFHPSSISSSSRGPRSVQGAAAARLGRHGELPDPRDRSDRKLTYTWVVGDIDTVVTFTLTPTASGTRLSLVQSGFRPNQKKNFGGARYGWRMMGGKLVDLLERIA
jgi:hypothetical protein